MEKLKIKILGLSCSNRVNSDIAWMVRYSLKIIDKFGRRVKEVAEYETEFVELADKDLKRCYNCDKRPCIPFGGKPTDEIGVEQSNAACHVKDYHQILGPKIQESDGLLIGSPTSLGTYNSRFRLLWECIGRGRENLGGIPFHHHNNRLPIGVLTCTDEGPGMGSETCLNDMNTSVRILEAMPVSQGHGATLMRRPSWREGKIPDGAENTVKNNPDYFRFMFYTARRVAEFALMIKLTKERLGDVYYNEFMGRYHEPWAPDELWAWRRLDPEDEKDMADFPIDTRPVRRM
ncbi:MAG: flavodoxin family protein [Deltaproteobacteria bacterium]|nr:flavodoxin family protein [Deltaproteobacteria bacterium]